MGLEVPFSLPAGSVSPFAGSVEPAGWLFMFGQAVSRTSEAALFNAIGTAYGVGDGSTTFNLPDARGRVLFGKDNMGGTPANRATTGGGGLDGLTLGAAGGGESVTLTVGQIAPHGHTFTQSATVGVGGNLARGGGVDATSNPSTSSGGGGSHSNIPPALVINYIIKT
jgi:microcystin-dependent protein